MNKSKPTNISIAGLGGRAKRSDQLLPDSYELYARENKNDAREVLLSWIWLYFLCSPIFLNFPLSSHDSPSNPRMHSLWGGKGPMISFRTDHFWGKTQATHTRHKLDHSLLQSHSGLLESWWEHTVATTFSSVDNPLGNNHTCGLRALHSVKY